MTEHLNNKLNVNLLYHQEFKRKKSSCDKRKTETRRK